MNPYKNYNSLNKSLNQSQREEGLNDQDSSEGKVTNPRQIGSKLKTPKITINIKRLLKNLKRVLCMRKALNQMKISDFACFSLSDPIKAYQASEVKVFLTF
jgi:hypothetical protein